MSNLILKKTTAAIFLAIVLIAGTFAAMSPSSFITGVNAQSEPYYGLDNRYNSYEPTDYGMDNRYDDRKSYDTKPYRNDNGYYESQYSSYEPNYKQKHLSYNDKDDKHKSKDSSININKINCISNINNINGDNTGNINLGPNGQVRPLADATAEEYFANAFGGNGVERYNDGYNNKQNKDLLCITNNNNNNTNVIAGPTGGLGGGGNQTGIINNNNSNINNNNNTNVIAGPGGGSGGSGNQTGSMIVMKEVFGCTEVFGSSMNCLNLENDSSEWISCDNIIISTTIFCQALPENIFDIEVLDEQDTQIQEFEGSEQGTTIQNLEPGTYTVNEIRHESGNNQLVVNSDSNTACLDNGFTGGGELIYSNVNLRYPQICFEYEDEQGNDCSTITLAAGEEKTCIVKNYIALAFGELEINDFTIDSPIKAQEKAESPDLTAMQKITKLKTQWLNQLP